jgi:hypothetical protein
MDSISNIFKSIMPFLAIGALVFVGYWVKLILDKNKNVKKAENCIWVELIPEAGPEKNFMCPVRMENGISMVRIPNIKGEVDEQTSPTHILGKPGTFPAIWPPGKAKFTQLSVQKIIFKEGDSEPLSNTTGIPTISGQLITSLLDGVATNTADAFRKSYEDSHGQTAKKTNPMLWVYVILGVIVVLGVVNLVLNIQGLSAVDMVKDLTKLIQQALGLK